MKSFVLKIIPHLFEGVFLVAVIVAGFSWSLLVLPVPESMKLTDAQSQGVESIIGVCSLIALIAGAYWCYGKILFVEEGQEDPASEQA